VVVRGAHFSPNHAGAKSLAFSRSKPRLGVVLVLVLDGCSRAHQLTRSLQRVPRAGLSGGADLAAGPPAPERRRAGGGGRSPSRPGDQLPPTTGAPALGWPYICPTARRSYWLPSARLPHFGHIATAGAAIGRDLEPVQEVVTGILLDGLLDGCQAHRCATRRIHLMPYRARCHRFMLCLSMTVVNPRSRFYR
jgi:hypothetical protein